MSWPNTPSVPLTPLANDGLLPRDYTDAAAPELIHEYSQKEVCNIEGLIPVGSDHEGKIRCSHVSAGTDDESANSAAKFPAPGAPRWWKRTRWRLLIVLMVLVVVAAIAVPIVLILKARNSKAASAGPITAASTSGAFVNTGIATQFAPQFDPDGDEFLYYQHYTGDIRWSSLTVGGGWANGEQYNPVTEAANARDGTPIAAVSYFANTSTELRRVAWIGRDDYLQDAWQLGGGSPWQPGELRSLGLRVAPYPNIGLSIAVIFKGPASNQTFESVQLFYGGADNLVHQISYDETTWTKLYTFPPNVNPYAGLSAIQPPQQNTSYLFFVDTHTNAISYFFQQLLSTTGSNWQEAAMSAPGASLRQNSSVACAQNFAAFYQTPENMIEAININMGSAQPWGSVESIGPGIPGTQMTARIFNSTDVWYQSSPNTITDATQLGGSGSAWGLIPMPVGT